MAKTGNFNRVILRLILVVLMMILAALLYLYYTISQPPIIVRRGKGFKHVLSIYGYGNNPNERLKQPHDVAFDTAGNIYISDTGHKRILVFKPDGRFLRQFGKGGTGRGEVMKPLGIAVDGRGRVFVADQTGGKVVVFDSRGRLVSELRIMMPLKPAVFGNRLYVTNYAFVRVYDLSNFRLLKKWGGRGRGRGQFDLPAGIAVGGDNRVFVTDLNNLRVQAFDSGGRVRWVLGKPSSPNPKKAQRMFGLPSGIAVDEKGRLFVVDAFDQKIVVLKSSNGAVLNQFSQEGRDEGELYYPAGIAYGGNNLFAVADKFNDRVQLLRITVR